MTNREFYEAITKNEITAEVIAHAQEAITKLDASNAKRREKSSKTAQANAGYAATLLSLMDKTPMTATALVERLANAGITEMNEKPVTRQKVSTLLKDAVASGQVVKSQVKVGDAKATAYAIAADYEA